MKAGGVLWFSDLTLPDSTWILPVCLGLTNLLVVEVSLLIKCVLTQLDNVIQVTLFSSSSGIFSAESQPISCSEVCDKLHQSVLRVDGSHRCFSPVCES